MPIAAMPGPSSQTSGCPPVRLISAADAEDDDGRDQPRQQQRRGGQQGAGQAGRAQQPRREPLDRAGVPPPDLGGDARPDPAEVNAAQMPACRRSVGKVSAVVSAGTAAVVVVGHPSPPPRAARRRRRARCARLFTVPCGDAGQLRHLGDRPVLDVHELPHLALGRAERAHRRGQAGLGGDGVRRGRSAHGRPGRLATPSVSTSGSGAGRARAGAGAARPGGGRSPTASRPPSSSGR